MAERRHYEVMLILDPRLEESTTQEAIERYSGVLTERGAEVTKVDTWGRRKLAFEINHLNEGFYSVVSFAAEPPAVDELDRVLGLADEVIRHKIIRPGKY